MMPRGLDVMAVLGNDEAVALLDPDLQQFKYGANLLAARRAVERYGKNNFEDSAYGMWLDSLRVHILGRGGRFSQKRQAPCHPQ